MSTKQTPVVDEDAELLAALDAADLDVSEVDAVSQLGAEPAERVAHRRGKNRKAAPVLALSQENMMDLLKALTTTRDTSPELTAAIKGISDLAKQVGRQADETARTVRKSNADHLHISAFTHPEGELVKPKPSLRYRTFVASQKVSKDELTPLEIELLNSFEGSKEARNGLWKATMKQNGSTPELHILFPCRTNDDLASVVPLTTMLSELHYGADATDTMTMTSRMLALEKELAAMKLAHPIPVQAAV